MTNQEFYQVSEEIRIHFASQINKAANCLYGRYLKNPCSFKDRDFLKASFSCYYWTHANPFEKKYGFRFVLESISREARRIVMEKISKNKLARKNENFHQSRARRH